MRHLERSAAAIAACIWMAGCATMDGTVNEVRPLGSDEVLVTSAEVRAILKMPVDPGPVAGRVTPRQVVCAEPSPDIAKAVSGSLSGSLGASVTGLPSGISPDAAVAIARVRAESAAQLGERLAAIQLLRDALYRACEAYANGAMSSTAYAVLLSRYDDTMITLLSSELAAGAFGRSLAGLGSEGTGEARSEARAEEFLKTHSEALSELTTENKRHDELLSELEQARSQRDEAESTLRKEQQGLDQAQARARELESAGAAPEAVGEASAKLDEARKSVAQSESKLATSEKRVATLEGRREESRKQVADAEQKATRSAEALTSGGAKAVVAAAGGITPGQQRAELAEQVANIQRKYIENINTDAIAVACITAMDNAYDSGRVSRLARYCDENKVLETIAKGQREILFKLIDSRLQIETEKIRAGALKASGKTPSGGD